MNWFRRIRMGLGPKLAVCVVAGTAALFTVFGLLNLRLERRHSQELVAQSADRIADLILRITRYEMLHSDREALHNMVQELGSEPGIRRIRIFNKEGRIMVSTAAPEINAVVDKSAEVCIGCHAQTSFARFNASDRARIFKDQRGERILGVMRPIENAAVCANASCHIHPAGRRVLGVVDANLSLATVDAQMAQHETTLVWFLASAIVSGSLMALLFIWAVIYRPVKELIQGTRRVAGGDLDYRLPVRSDDELGDLAASFNGMTAEVAGVHARIEEQVRRKTAELEIVYKNLLSSEKMASIGKMAATVAHEINNPLFGILTYAGLVQRELLKHEFPGRDEVAGQLDIIEHESNRCGDLVKNLLTFARQAPSRRELSDLTTVVQRSVALVKHKLDLQGAGLKVNLAGGLPPLECDANQIEQAILVLLVNASEAVEKGGAVEISTEFDPASGQVSIRVKDTGCGIPGEVLPHVFDPFFTTKEDQNRTGLGLAVAHSIVEQHAGKISVLSTPGKGTEFRIALPAAVSAAVTVMGQ